MSNLDYIYSIAIGLSESAVSTCRYEHPWVIAAEEKCFVVRVQADDEYRRLSNVVYITRAFQSMSMVTGMQEPGQENYSYIL